MAKRMPHPRDPRLAAGRNWRDILREFQERGTSSTSNSHSGDQVPEATPETQPRTSRPQTARRGRRFTRRSATPLYSRRSPPLYERRRSTNTTSSAETEFMEDTPPPPTYHQAGEQCQNHRQDSKESHNIVDSDDGQGPGDQNPQNAQTSGAQEGTEGAEFFSADDFYNAWYQEYYSAAQEEVNGTEVDRWTPPPGRETPPRGRDPYFGLFDWDVTQTENVVLGNLRRVERTIRMTLILEPWGWNPPRHQCIMWPSEPGPAQSHDTSANEAQENRSTSSDDLYSRRESQQRTDTTGIVTNEEQPSTSQQAERSDDQTPNIARTTEPSVTPEGWYAVGVPAAVVQQLTPRIWQVLRKGKVGRSKRVYKLPEGRFRVIFGSNDKVTITVARSAEGK